MRLVLLHQLIFVMAVVGEEVVDVACGVVEVTLEEEASGEEAQVVVGLEEEILVVVGLEEALVVVVVDSEVRDEVLSMG